MVTLENERIDISISFRFEIFRFDSETKLIVATPTAFLVGGGILMIYGLRFQMSELYDFRCSW